MLTSTSCTLSSIPILLIPPTSQDYAWYVHICLQREEGSELCATLFETHLLSLLDHKLIYRCRTRIEIISVSVGQAGVQIGNAFVYDFSPLRSILSQSDAVLPIPTCTAAGSFTASSTVSVLTDASSTKTPRSRTRTEDSRLSSQRLDQANTSLVPSTSISSPPL